MRFPKIYTSVIISLLTATSAAVADDPFLDLLQNKRYDRELILQQFQNVTVQATPADSAPPENSGDAAAAPSSPASPTPPEATEFLHLNATPSPSVVARPEVYNLALVLPTDAGGFSQQAADFFYKGCLRGLDYLGEITNINLYSSDNTTTSALAAYQTAVSESPQMIIGPLLKPHINALLELYPDAPAPTILLQPGEGRGNNYYALSINIEEEVAALAALIFRSGAQVLMVSDNSDISKRQARAFNAAWGDLSRALPERFYVYQPDKDWRRLFEKLKTGESKEDEPIRWAVFVAGNTALINNARNFIPQGIPVYASSIYTDNNAEFLDNLWVLEMPWFIDDAVRNDFSSPIVRTTDELKQRFYALGIDSCRVAKRFPAWREGWRLEGVSGVIELRDNHFTRRETLAKYQAGRLVLPLP